MPLKTFRSMMNEVHGYRRPYPFHRSYTHHRIELAYSRVNHSINQSKAVMVGTSVVGSAWLVPRQPHKASLK